MIPRGLLRLRGPARALGLTAGLLGGLTAGPLGSLLGGLTAGLTAGLSAGLTAGLFAGLACAPSPPLAAPPLCPEAAGPADPAPTVSASPVASASAASPATAAGPRPSPGAGRLLWERSMPAGDVVLVSDGAGGVFVMPSFLGSTVEGGTLGRLDAAGGTLWSAGSGYSGFRDVARGPGGTVLALPVQTLNWPKTAKAYASGRLLRVDAHGKRVETSLGGGQVDASSLTVDAHGRATIQGEFLGTIRAGANVLRATGEPVCFVMQVDPAGHPLWARAATGPLTGAASTAEGELVALTGQGNTWSLLRFDLAGVERSRVRLPTLGPCNSGLQGPWLDAAGRVYLLSPSACFAITPEKGGGAEVIRLLADGTVDWVRLLPDADSTPLLAVEASGAIALGFSDKILELSPQGAVAWSAVTSLPPDCIQGGGVTSLVIDEVSVFLAVACWGDRIGTMFNSPYSRASDRSQTHVSRLARR